MTFPFVRTASTVIVGFAATALLATVAVSGSPTAPRAYVRGSVGATTTDDVSRAEASHAVRVRRTYRVAATAVKSTVEVGSTIKIRGSAVTRLPSGSSKRRPVRLQERKRAAWRSVAKRRTTRAGAYTFRIDAGKKARTRVFRVKAPPFRGLAAAKTDSIKVNVLATAPEPETFDEPEPLPDGYVGAGTVTEWSYLFDGGARWNPCRVIRWRYNPAGQGYAALDDVKRAFARISGASGLRFRYEGTTEFRMLDDVAIWEFPTDEMDISIAWASEDEESSFAGGRVALGGGGITWTRDGTDDGTDVKYRMNKGYVLLDNGDVLPGGFDQSGWGQVLLHEILHALGLGHAAEDVQLMYFMMHENNLNFGAGDLTGMAKVGAAGGCLR